MGGEEGCQCVAHRRHGRRGDGVGSGAAAAAASLAHRYVSEVVERGHMSGQVGVAELELVA